MTTLDPRPTADRPSGDPPEMLLVAPRRSVRQHLADVWAYRELLSQLVRRELKVKYKNSALGFAWSLLNPAFQMLIYWLVFSIFLGNDVPHFAIWLLTGLLVWNLFTGSLIGGTNSVVGNAFLVGKVRFPREVLPLASVGASLIHFFLQLIVLMAVIVGVGHDIDWAWVPMAVPALITLVVLGSALAILLSAVNVYARDTQHLLELVIQAWFWLSCIIVPYVSIGNQLQERDLPASSLLMNPVTSVVITMQRAFYGESGLPGHLSPDHVGYLPDGSWLWYLRNLGVVFAVSVVLLLLAIRIFDRVEGNFAEVL
jgi:ABC-2 type transport system permease protein